MKKYYQSLFRLIILLVVTLFIVFEFKEDLISMILLISLLISMGVMSFLNRKLRFILLLTYILGLGFFYIGYAWMIHANNDLQIIFIKNHLIVSFMLFIYWLILKQIQNVYVKNEEYKKRIKELERFKDSTSILSFADFIDRTNFFIAGAKRRNEQNWLLVIRIESGVTYKKSVMHILKSVGLDTFRSHYDLIAQFNKSELVVFLQNTDADGASMAEKRFLDQLRTQFNEIDMPFTIKNHQLINDVYYTLGLIKAGEV